MKMSSRILLLVALAVSPLVLGVPAASAAAAAARTIKPAAAKHSPAVTHAATATTVISCPNRRKGSKHGH